MRPMLYQLPDKYLKMGCFMNITPFPMTERGNMGEP